MIKVTKRAKRATPDLEYQRDKGQVSTVQYGQQLLICFHAQSLLRNVFVNFTCCQSVFHIARYCLRSNEA